MPVFFLVLGSFINVLLYRIPRGENIAYPRSRCPHCKTVLDARELVPIFSFFIQQGKCRSCRSPIPWRYTVVEFISMVTMTSTWLLAGVAWIPYTSLLFVLIVITFIDLDHFYIPDKLLITGAVLWVGLRIFLPFIAVREALLGAALGFSIMLVIYVLSRGGMGFGDVKLAALIGLYLGPSLVVLTLLVSFVVGAVAGISLMALKIKGRKDMLPFGPFLAIGAYISMLLGPMLILWYTNMIGF